MCKCKDQWESYSFQIRSLDQIDTDAIESELSHKNPVLVMEVEGQSGCRVFIHETVWTKAWSAGKDTKGTHNCPPWTPDKKLAATLMDLTQNYEDDNGFVPRHVAEKIINTVRRIKKSKWDRRQRAEVTVYKPTIEA